MLEIPRTLLNEDTAAAPRILVAGVGNAGVTLIDRLTLAGFGNALDLAAINTDSVSLGSSVAPTKVLIGSNTARGLGTGGDPEIGAEAADENSAELGTALESANIVIVCAGLGGGAGSGAAPVVAELARNNGALVVALATMPFSFEGKRRVKQAEDAQAALAKFSDAFLTFENDRMADLTEPLAGVHDTFAASDQVLADTIASIARLALTQGPVRVTLADLLAIFRKSGAKTHFGFAEASGPNRAHEAVERALKSHLLARGKALADATATLVHISAAPDLRLAETRAIMEAVARHTDGHLHLGIGLDAGYTNLGVAILATSGGTREVRVPVRKTQVRPEPEVVAEAESEPEEADVEAEAAPKNPSELFDTSPYAVAKAGAAKKPKPEQKTLRLDAVARGRFEKSEPTIIGGEDLDVPTYLRQKIKLH
ncbi:MAG: cell division protein FtsZ [Chthoniobacterales bacterium]